MIVDIILGCSYGDEGKGKVVNSLMDKNKYDLTVRFNGSCNAGHTVYRNGQKFVLHQLPVGILTDNSYTLISSDCLVDYPKLEKEIEEIVDEKGNIMRKKIPLSSNLPYSVLVDLPMLLYAKVRLRLHEV